MHTDEYGITLSREVNICNRKLREIRAFLSSMEERYRISTEDFIGRHEDGGIDGRDAAAWKENYAALKTWTRLKEEYDDLYRRMR